MSNNERVNIMCNNNREQEGNCIAEILKVICILQQNACPDNILDSCDRPMLGGGSGNCLVILDQSCFIHVVVMECQLVCQQVKM